MMPGILFALSVFCATYLFGAYSCKAETDYLLFAKVAPNLSAIENPASARLNPGLVLVMGVNADRKSFVRVIDRDGGVLHEWDPDWFEIWGGEGVFPEDRRPISSPGALLHGVEVLPSGDLIVNFEYLSTMRLGPCGEVVWKLDNLGHHSVHVDEDGDIWVAVEDFDDESNDNPLAPRTSWTIEKISPDGLLLDTIDILDVLKTNGLEGLLYLSSSNSLETEIIGDGLHLNDVEIFPSYLRSTMFRPGDIMFSLRNINTVIVIDPASHAVKFRATGTFGRQHDPDFMDDDRISVLDNRHLPPADAEEPASRIVEIDARAGETSIILDGAGATPFYTVIMGEHQRLPNSGILVTSSRERRVFEALPDGELAWSYRNLVDQQLVGVVTMGKLPPPEMDRAAFEALASGCD